MHLAPQTPDTPKSYSVDGDSFAASESRDIKPTFAELEGSHMQSAVIQSKLNRRLGPEYISQRPSPGGGPKLTYVEGWRIIMLANEVFGFNGWSSNILMLETDYCDVHEETKRISCGITATVRVTLKDGTYHEDVGYGTAENLKSKGAALDKAKKEAVTDAVKRALRNFGNLLGLCLYEKQFAQEVVKFKPQPKRKFDDSDLYRQSDYDTSTSTVLASPAAGPSTAVQQQEPDIKPPGGLPPHMRALVHQAAQSPLNGKGRASDVSPSAGETELNTPMPDSKPQQAIHPPEQPGPQSRPAAIQPRPALAQPPHPQPVPQFRTQNITTASSHVSASMHQRPSAQAAPWSIHERKVAFVPKPLPPKHDLSLPVNLKAETSDDLDAFFGSDDDALLAAYEGVGTEAASAEGAVNAASTATPTASSTRRESPRPPSQPAGGFRFPPDFATDTARPPTSHANTPTASGSRQHVSEVTVAGIKRPSEAMQHQIASKRPINGQGMGFANQQQQRQLPPANFDSSAGGDVKRVRR